MDAVRGKAIRPSESGFLPPDLLVLSDPERQKANLHNREASMNHPIHPAAEQGAPPPSSQKHLGTDVEETAPRRVTRPERQEKTPDAPQYDSFMRIIRR